MSRVIWHVAPPPGGRNLRDLSLWVLRLPADSEEQGGTYSLLGSTRYKVLPCTPYRRAYGSEYKVGSTR